MSFGYSVCSKNQKNNGVRRNESIGGVNFHVGNDNVDLKEESNSPLELKRCTTTEKAGNNECEEIKVSNLKDDVNFATNLILITEINELESLESDLGDIESNLILIYKVVKMIMQNHQGNNY